MAYRTLITTSELADHLAAPDWAIVDCRFSLAEPDRGRLAYREGHIPGAVYAHLNEDLSSPVIPGVTGRHPLPKIEMAVHTFSGWGIDEQVQVVAYDDWGLGGGASAARLWWLLRWLGHEAVAVLDGGWGKWAAENRPVDTGVEYRAPRQFKPELRSGLLASTQEVDVMRRDPQGRVFDSRALERYRGETEPFDPVAGHIPGAKPAPYAENLGTDGQLLAHKELRERFRNLLGGTAPENAVFYCGSGVTAAYNVLAMAHAGLGDARLYNGSWSEWITNPDRPVELGLPDSSDPDDSPGR